MRAGSEKDRAEREQYYVWWLVCSSDYLVFLEMDTEVHYLIGFMPQGLE